MLTARGIAEEKPSENIVVAAAWSLLSGFSDRFHGGGNEMTMPSLLTWVIGAAVLVVLSVLLRYVANEADEVARSQGRASVAAEPKGAGTFRKAA